MESWNKDSCSQIRAYSRLVDGTYYLIRGSELMNAIDLSEVSPTIAGLVRRIKPLTRQIEPCSKQLDYYLTQDANNG